MKIVQAVGWYFPDSLGGTEVYVAALAARLRAASHAVVVAAPDASASAVREYHHDGVPVFRYPVPSSPTRAEARGTTPAPGSEAFHAWLARERPDVVHFHTFVTGLGLIEVRAAREAGARVIVTTHSSQLGFLCERGTLMLFGRRPCDGMLHLGRCAACALEARGAPRPLAAALSLLPVPLGRQALRWPSRLGTALGMRALIADNRARQRELVAGVDRFVVLTAWALQALAANGLPREKLALNRLGVSHGMQPKPGPKAQPTKPPIRVGYVGRFEALKGVEDLVQAVRSLPADVPLRLEVRGPAREAADRDARERLVRLAGDDARIRFEAEVAPERIPEVLAGYDLVCCPSRCHEGGPTVALEAHAVGTPVVGSRIGGLAEIVLEGATGMLFEPGDWRALARLLEAAARDPGSSIERWREALERPRSMDDVARDYLALYTVPARTAA